MRQIKSIIILSILILDIFNTKAKCETINLRNLKSSNKMFCFQCEQTAKCEACTQSGVCTKSPKVAYLQDRLIGSLVNLSFKGKESLPTDELVIYSLFTTITNANFDEKTLNELIEKVHKKSGDNEEYCMNKIWDGNEDIRSLKSLILFGLKGMAAYAYHALVLGYRIPKVNSFFYEALRAIGSDLCIKDLLDMALKVGEMNYKAMALLDEANTKTYGDPVPTEVSFTVKKGPFIVITGHDLFDLEHLLDQTEGTGINIYTHGEMIPAHGYPELKKYPHLAGNFGTAWQNQQKEFDGIPAPIIFTTNCLMKPKESYIDRVFTTEVVEYPGVAHLHGHIKDFTPVINKALELGGYDEDKVFTGINGGERTMVGFGRKAILSNAETIVKAVKDGEIKHFFLVAGCDGIKKERSYFTEFVKKTPKDTIVLTCACGKFRFNDLDLGKIGNFPRIMDMGQCNDAYGAIQVAIALSEAFKVGVNELPLSMIISWYEQKAVAVLLTLLHLGIKNIRLGPTLPAFISPNVLDMLVKNYNLGIISTVDADLKAILG